MALTTNLAREKYTGDGSTTVFTFHFSVWQTSQIKVYTGSDTTQTEVTSGITIALTGQSGTGEKATGGTVTFTTAPSSGVKVAICRSMPFTQDDVYVSGARFDAHEIEDRLDMDCAERQQILDIANRSIQVPSTSDLTQDEFTEQLLTATQTAITKASEAAGSATSAASSATAAATSATNAATSATNAATSATNAATSATNASTYASNSLTYANQASASATAAATSATSAASSATSASQTLTTIEAAVGSHFMRWAFSTVAGTIVYSLRNPDPLESDSTKYLVFYGTDLLDTDDYTISTVDKSITLTSTPTEVVTVTVVYIKYGAIEEAKIPAGTIFSVIGAASDYCPYGAVPCDGAQYSRSQFTDFYDGYLLPITGRTTAYLETCSFSDFETAVASYGSCAKWGLDTWQQKFYVPKIADGLVLQQAMNTTELNKVYQAGLPNIQGSISGIYNLGTGQAYSGALSADSNTSIVKGSGSTVLYKENILFNANSSNSIYGNSSTVQPKAVTVRYFVMLVNTTNSTSLMDWSAWATSLAGKASTSDLNTKLSLGGGTMTGGIIEKSVALSGTSINATNGAVFTKTFTSGTSYSMTFTNPADVATVVLICSNAGGATVSFSGVKWSGGTVPTLSTGIDILTFIVVYQAGGTPIVYGFVGGTDMAV